MVSAVWVFAGALALFAATLYPALAPRDAADMARAALTAGVAHPPGYPLYALLGRAWIELIPWGNPAYRLNLLSAVAAAGAVSVLFALLRRRGLGLPESLGAALSFAFAAPVWKFALLAEKYAFHALFAVCLWALAEGSRASFYKRACLAGLVLGLGLVNHQSLLLLIPALAWQWERERRCAAAPAGAWAAAAGFCLLGLALNLAVLARLKDIPLTWAVLIRAEYGSLELFKGFGSELTAQTAAALLAHFANDLFWTSPVAAVYAVASVRYWGLKRGPELLALLCTGPVFFLMTRFDLSSWVARSVLEPAFILPCLFLCLLSAEGIGPWARRSGWLAALVLVAAPFVLNFRRASHRDDFSAMDYLKDLRRALPPDSSAIVAGDTALFGLRYIQAWLGDDGRNISSNLEPDLASWVARRRAAGPLLVAGLPLEALRELGLSPAQLKAAGLAVGAGWEAPDRTLWELSTLRRPAAFGNGESYAHDVRLAYAFARHNAARLAQKRGEDSTRHQLWSVIHDPEDFDLE